MKSKKVNTIYVTAFNEEKNKIGKQHIQRPNSNTAYCGYYLGNDFDPEKMDDSNFCKTCFKILTK